MSSVGESVASDKLARLSMIRFTQSIWTAVKGEVPRAREPMQAVDTATIFTTSCAHSHMGKNHYVCHILALFASNLPVSVSWVQLCKQQVLIDISSQPSLIDCAARG